MNKIKGNIQRRAIKNTVVGFLSFIVSFAQAFISVPILLHYWGNETYAVWLALIAGVALFQSIDNGHINYVGNKINLLYHYDKNELKKNLSSSFILSLSLGLIQIIIIIVLISFNLLSNILGISGEMEQGISISLSFFILVLSWFISGSYGGILHRLMIPAGYYTQSLWWGILYKISQFVSVILVVMIGGNILDVSIVYAIVQLIVYMSTFFYIKVKIPEFYPWWVGGEKKTAFINFRNSLLLTFNGIVQQLNGNGVVLFISNFVSTKAVPVFTTLKTITNSANSVTNILINSLLPDIARFHANADTRRLNTIFSSHLFFSGLLVNTGIILIIPFIARFYSIWTRGQVDFNNFLFLCLAISISLINFGSGYYFYLVSINNIKAQSVITFVRAAVIFIFGYLLIPKFGLSGIGIAIIFSEIISSMILPYYFTKKIIKSINGQLEIKPLLIAILAPLVLSLVLIAQFFKINLSFSLWLLTLFLLLIIYFYTWFNLDKEIKLRFKDLFIKMRNR